MSFRIKSVRFENKTISGFVDGLSNDGNESNHYTLIIGNNGCGKSTLMKTISLYFSKESSSKSYSANVDTNGLFPSRTIVSTNGIGDTYYKAYSTIPDMQTPYIYLGTRGNYSKKFLFERACMIFIESNLEDEQLCLNEELCKFVGYSTRFRLVYKLNKTKKEILDSMKANKDKFKILENETISISNYNWDKGEVAELFIDFKSPKNLDFHGKGGLNIFKILRKINAYKLTNVFVSKYDSFLNTFSADNMSSGEVNLLTSLLSLNASIIQNSLILIDEPEISLHPEWQIKYMSKIHDIVNLTTGCHVIIASHSHFLVSDLDPNNSTLLILEKNSNNNNGFNITSRSPKSSPYAWSAENILMEVFNVSSTRNFYFAQKIEQALTLLGKHNRDEKELQDVIQKIKMVYPSLSENDPLHKVAQIIINNHV